MNALDAMRQRVAELEQEVAYLRNSNRALATMLADAYNRIGELDPPTDGRPRLTVLDGGGT